jgi:hypothetical protein
MGVGSPVELSKEKYKQYLLKLENFDATQTKEVENVSDFSLSESQKEMIRSLVSSTTLQEAKMKLEDVFLNKLPELFDSVTIGENKLNLKFKNVSYTFIKEASDIFKDLKVGGPLVVPIPEAEIKSDKEFKNWIESVLKKAHGTDYDQKIVDKMIKDLKTKYKDDFGAMVGAASSGLGGK